MTSVFHPSWYETCSYPTTVLNERMCHFRRGRGSKHAVTPLTYFQEQPQPPWSTPLNEPSQAVQTGVDEVVVGESGMIDVMNDAAEQRRQRLQLRQHLLVYTASQQLPISWPTARSYFIPCYLAYHARQNWNTVRRTDLQMDGRTDGLNRHSIHSLSCLRYEKINDNKWF